MGHSTKLLTTTQTAGDFIVDEMRQEISTKLTSSFAQSGVGPTILWGEWAMLYYGVPIGDNHMHLLVPNGQLNAAYDALAAAGFKKSPPVLRPKVNSLDPNIRWEELGCPARRFVGDILRLGSPLKILVQNYSVAGSTFDETNPSSFVQCAGLAIPPLQVLGESFLRAYFKSAGSKSRLRSILAVWCASVKLSGYTPLGIEAMRGKPGIDNSMALYWERGY